MFSIFSKKKQDISLPEWADFLNQDEYNIFIEIIDKYFKSKQLKYSINESFLKVDDLNAGFSEEGVNLIPIAQYCLSQEKNIWEMIVQDHFEAISHTNKFEKEFQSKIHDFSQIEQYLAVRLFHVVNLEDIGIQNVVCRKFSDDLLETLVFDFPHATRTVKPEEIQNSGLARDVLFEIALSNVKNNYDLDISAQRLGEIKIWFIQNEHLFGTSFLTDREELNKRCGLYGAIVAVPHRHAMMVYPIENIQVVKAITFMIQVTLQMFHEGPGSISEKIYWYNGKSFMTLPYDITENQLEFTPPDIFMEMLNVLPNEESN